MDYDEFKPYSKDWIKQGNFEIRPSDDGTYLEVPSCLYKKIDQKLPLEVEDCDDLLSVLRDYPTTIASMLGWSEKRVQQAVDGLFEDLDIPKDINLDSDFSVITHK